MDDIEIEKPKPPKGEPRMPIEHWAKECKTQAWVFAGLKVLKHWAIGQEVTRKAYEKAADDMAHLELGYRNRFAVKGKRKAK